MPRLWTDTIETHRRQVTDAILDATAALIVEHGPVSVAMAAIAERAGIGRATLYKYFPDVESILVAWHARQFETHLGRLRALSESPAPTLDDVATFVRAQRAGHLHGDRSELVGALAQALAGAEAEVLAALTALLRRLAGAGEVRDDRAPEVLAAWLLHAVHAPSDLDGDTVADLVVASLSPAPPSGAARARRSPRLDRGGQVGDGGHRR